MTLPHYEKYRYCLLMIRRLRHYAARALIRDAADAPAADTMMMTPFHMLSRHRAAETERQAARRAASATPPPPPRKICHAAEIYTPTPRHYAALRQRHADMPRQRARRAAIEFRLI